MRRPIIGLTLVLAAVLLVTGIYSLEAQGLPRPQTWADCELFDGVVTPATFNPASEPFDKLFAGGSVKGGAKLGHLGERVRFGAKMSGSCDGSRASAPARNPEA